MLTLQQSSAKRIKRLNLQCCGIFCIAWHHFNVFMKCFHGKLVCLVIWWAPGKEKSAGFLEIVVFCEAFHGNFKRELCFIESVTSYDISTYLLLCLHLFNISVRLFSLLLFLCNAIFSFSFKHNEHLLRLVLYAWCLPKISHVMFALRVLSFIFQNSPSSSVSDLFKCCFTNTLVNFGF